MLDTFDHIKYTVHKVSGNIVFFVFFIKFYLRLRKKLFLRVFHELNFKHRSLCHPQILLWCQQWEWFTTIWRNEHSYMLSIQISHLHILKSRRHIIGEYRTQFSSISKLSQSFIQNYHICDGTFYQPQIYIHPYVSFLSIRSINAYWVSYHVFCHRISFKIYVLTYVFHTLYIWKLCDIHTYIILIAHMNTKKKLILIEFERILCIKFVI